MRLKLSWMVLAERTVVSASQMVTIVDVIERVATDVLPAQLPRTSLVAQLYRDQMDDSEPFDSEIRITLVQPNGSSVVLFEAHAHIDRRNARLLTDMSQLTFPDHGRYFIVMESKNGADWERMGALPVYVDPVSTEGGTIT